MSERLHGRCHCGGVAFSIPADSAGVVACHCEDCRKMHGNYNAMLAAPRGDVQFEQDAVQRQLCMRGIGAGDQHGIHIPPRNHRSGVGRHIGGAVCTGHGARPGLRRHRRRPAR